MYRLKPLFVSLATATALSILPVSFGTLPVPLGVVPAEAAASISINIFFKPLASHGVWVKHSKYRYVFCPKVDAKWRPYSHGHWIYMKNYGWYFASDEPFAWAVYHYGRWFHDQRAGWCWVPGNAWAGAWVAWRKSNDYIGWAALPPAKEGFSVNVDFGTAEPPKEEWVFVPPKRFLEPKLSVAVVFGDQQPDVFQKTEFVGPVVVQNNIVVNNVIDVNFIQQQTGEQVKVVEPQPVSDPAQAAAEANGTTVAVFAPQIEPPKQDEAPEQAVDEAQAPAQNGNGGTDQTSSASSEQPSSSAASSEASSSEASSSAASSEAASSASSSEAASSASSSEAVSSSAEATPASSSEAAPASSSSEAVPASSSEAAPASSSEEQAAPASSSEQAAPASSSESAAPASSSEEQAAPASSEQAAPASSEEQAAPSSAECPEGYEIVDGKCVPIKASGDTSEQAPAQ
jgi:hypothetical protein